MAIPTDTTLTNLDRPYISPGWYPGGFIDQFIRKVPFQRLDKSTTDIKWNRGTVTALSPYTAPPTIPLPEAATDTTQQVTNLRRIGDYALVDYMSQLTTGDPNDLLQVQIEAKKVAIVRALGSQILQGNGTAPNLSSLIQGATSGAGGNEFNVTAFNLPSLDDLHKLVNLVQASDGIVGAGADCIVTNERVIRYIIKLLEGRDDVPPSTNKGALGGTNVWVYDPDLGVPVPHFHGIPMYIGQVLNDGLLGFDIWALKMSGPTGIRVLHATGSSEEFGIDVLPVPMRDNNAQIGAFVGGLYALMIPEFFSIARLRGTTTTALTGQGIAAFP